MKGALLALLYIGQDHDTLWHPNLSALSTATEAESAVDGRLRADLGAPDSRYLVVVTGADKEAALAAAERAGKVLDGLVNRGVIAGYDSPARFLPSHAAQAARRAALPDADTLRPR